jgi:hypothetical protein
MSTHGLIKIILTNKKKLLKKEENLRETKTKLIKNTNLNAMNSN